MNPHILGDIHQRQWSERIQILVPPNTNVFECGVSAFSLIHCCIKHSHNDTKNGKQYTVSSIMYA